jgi:hypothetical protein
MKKFPGHPFNGKIVVFMVTKNPGQSQFMLMDKYTDYNGCPLARINF